MSLNIIRLLNKVPLDMWVGLYCIQGCFQDACLSVA